MLDVAVGRQDQRLDADARRELGKVLAGQGVQPAEPVGPGDGDDLPMRPIDQSRRERLLTQRIAVVGRNELVRRISGDGAGAAQQHAGLRGRSGIGDAHEQSLHRPEKVTWRTSTRKPRSRSRRATTSATYSVEIGSTPSQRLQTRWTWASSVVAW